MAAKTYSLDFDGYWRSGAVAGLPASSGVYCVYACTHDARSRTVSLKRLLYIGEAVNIRDRVTAHERWDDWRRRLNFGEELCFNAALISPQADRERAEAAMIFKHKPPCNTQCVDTFRFDTTTIWTSGKNALLNPQFTVSPTPASLGLAGLGTFSQPRW